MWCWFVLVQEEHEGEGLCSELEYSLKRLVRGLASNRKAARHGYFVTLTEVYPLICVSKWQFTLLFN